MADKITINGVPMMSTEEMKKKIEQNKK